MKSCIAFNLWLAAFAVVSAVAQPPEDEPTDIVQVLASGQIETITLPPTGDGATVRLYVLQCGSVKMRLFFESSDSGLEVMKGIREASLRKSRVQAEGQLINLGRQPGASDEEKLLPALLVTGLTIAQDATEAAATEDAPGSFFRSQDAASEPADGEAIEPGNGDEPPAPPAVRKGGIWQKKDEGKWRPLTIEELRELGLPDKESDYPDEPSEENP